MNKHQISRFCSQLQILLQSGVPLVEALGIVGQILKCRNFDRSVVEIVEGSTLAQALKGQLPAMAISLLESAEQVGNLEEVLGRLGKYYQTRAEAEDKIKSALIYPTFIMMLCFSSLAVMFVFVLPSFKSLFADLGSELPWFTRSLMSLGDYWYVPFLFILTILGLVWLFRQKLMIEARLLKLKFYFKSQIAQAFQTLGSMLEGGASIITALDSTIASCRNKVFKLRLQEIKTGIEHGQRLSALVLDFPQEAIQMIRVGENSGQLGQMLISIANFYEQEKQVAIKRFTSLLEPMLTLIVGLVVGLIAVSMFVPMLSVLEKIQ